MKREKKDGFKYMLYLSFGVLVVIVIAFIITFIIYNNKINDSSYSPLKIEQIAKLVPNFEQTETTSLEVGKSVEEQKEKNENMENKEETIENIVEESEESEPEPIVIQDPQFIIPVDGEINRGYAKDTLVYSDTLQEWVTHTGIDILAEKTTIVKAAAEGIVTSIKTDPRYGITVIIEHVNDFKTLYSNLLTAEFVKEGEKVVSGQTVGTVGKSATFEIIDEPHLHFEITKAGEYLNPTLYIY